MSEKLTTVVLGDEYDEVLRDAIKIILELRGAINVDKSWGVGGSQELETINVRLDDTMVTIESETFVGLTITGPSSTIETLSRQILDQFSVLKKDTGIDG